MTGCRADVDPFETSAPCVFREVPPDRPPIGSSCTAPVRRMHNAKNHFCYDFNMKSNRTRWKICYVQLKTESRFARIKRMWLMINSVGGNARPCQRDRRVLREAPIGGAARRHVAAGVRGH